jgi:hypothetical protein
MSSETSDDATESSPHPDSESPSQVQAAASPAGEPLAKRASSPGGLVVVALAATAALVVAWFAHIIPHH